MQAVLLENKSLGSTAFLCSDIFKTTQAPQYCGICVVSRQKKKSGYSIKIVTLIWWTFRDSNPGPTGYEPVALTN